MRKRVNLVIVRHGILSSSRLKYTASVREFEIIYSVSYKEIVVCEQVGKKFESNIFATVGNAKEADLRIWERHVSEDLSPLEDTKRTDFQILKITKHVIVFVAAAILQL